MQLLAFVFARGNKTRESDHEYILIKQMLILDDLNPQFFWLEQCLASRKITKPYKHFSSFHIPLK